MPKVQAAVSFNLDPGLIQACLPLFQSEAIEAIEWSFDTLHDRGPLPDWFEGLLGAYGSAGRLVGHGVYFSLFAGKWRPEQDAWLAELRRLSQQFTFDHVSEHFGFLTGADFHKGAPLSVPYSTATLAIGRDRLLRLADACGCPVGLENLAFASSMSAAERHGQFLEELLSPVNGFLLLDLHNLYCHLHNFGLDAGQVLGTYPLERVRELHISGGSWEPSVHRPAPGVRRDTHDDCVPMEVWELLRAVVPQCPNLKFVVLEQMGVTLGNVEAQAAFRSDYQQLQRILEAMPGEGVTNNGFVPPASGSLGKPLEDMGLQALQSELSRILEQSGSLEEVYAAMDKSLLAGTDWDAGHWDPAMLETARLIARKWKEGMPKNFAW